MNLFLKNGFELIALIHPKTPKPLLLINIDIFLKSIKMPSNVRVAVRVRPLLGSEISNGHKQQLLEVNTA